MANPFYPLASPLAVVVFAFFRHVRVAIHILFLPEKRK